MAKIASSPTIDVAVDIGQVKPKMDEVNKALNTVSATPIEKLRDKSAAAMDSLNAKIAATVANLEKLKTGVANTGGVDTRLLKKTEAEFERLKRLGVDKATTGKISSTLDQIRTAGGVSSTKGGGGAGGVKEIGNNLDDIIGGKFSLQKGAKFGIAGLVGSFLADTAAGASKSLVGSLNEGDQAGLSDREQVGGIRAGINAIGKDLPIVSGLLATCDNIHEAWTGIRAETERTNAVIALQDQASKRHLETLRDQQHAIRDLRDSEQDRNDKFDASVRGGTAGRVLTVDANARVEQRALEKKRDDEIEARNLKLAEDLKPLEAQRKSEEGQLNNPRLAEGARSRLAAINGSEKLLKSDAAAGNDLTRQRFDQDSSGLQRQAAHDRGVADGSIFDQKGFEDSVDSLQKRTRTLDGSPVEALRKQFKEFGDATPQALKAAEDAIKDFGNAQVDALVDQKSEAGLSEIEKTLQRFTKQGADGEHLIKLKIDLEEKAAQEATVRLKEEIEGIDRHIAVSLAPNEPARIRQQAIGENDARKEGKLGPADLEKEIGKRLDDYFATKAAEIREATKDPADRLKERVAELDELRKRTDPKTGDPLITDAQYKKARGQASQDFADATRTSRPDLMEAGSAATDQFLTLLGGQVIDAAHPELAMGAGGLLQGFGGGSSDAPADAAKEVPKKIDRTNDLLEQLIGNTKPRPASNITG